MLILMIEVDFNASLKKEGLKLNLSITSLFKILKYKQVETSIKRIILKSVSILKEK